MKIEVFKASVKDKKPTIRTKDIEPVADLKRFKKGTKFDVTVNINGTDKVLRFHLSRPAKGLTNNCATIYGDTEWKNNFPHIDIGEKTFITFKNIKLV